MRKLPVEPISVGGRKIGPGEPCFVIAEIGINHNGKVDVARRLIDAAIAAKVDEVKFQKRSLKELYPERLLEQPRIGEQGLQYIVPILKEFELSDADFRSLRAYCADKGILFLCTPWDHGSVDFLEGLDVAAYKIGSPDMTNFPLIERVLATGRTLFVSTGMSTEEEIRRTIALLRDRQARFGLFHCVSTYPAAADEINLRFMQVLQEWSGAPVGYSGHDTGLAVTTAAIGMGACIVERHLTLDRTMRGPDHKASLEPAEFAAQVRAIREAEACLGIPHRWITRGEVLNRRVLGKSLVAAVDVEAGTVVQRGMVTVKSPGLGLSAQRLDELVGRTLRRSLRRDEPFLEDDVAAASPAVAHRKLDVGLPWGIVARFTDLESLLKRFEGQDLSFVEFHVSDRDLDAGLDAMPRQEFPFDLIVHAPEYCHDVLIDLCATDREQLDLSVSRLQKTIDLARSLAPSFARRHPRGPKVVIHVGGMAREPQGYDLSAATERLLRALRRVDHTGVDLLVENLPPYPWYFGGRWFGFVLTDAANTVEICRASGLGLCFDTSHAGLACNQSGQSLRAFADAVAPFTRHLHVSDAAGTSGEGLQIGEGVIDFMELLQVFEPTQPTMVPEIWMGHHSNGLGFRLALQALTDLRYAARVLAGPRVPATEAEIEALLVAPDASLLSAIATIDASRMGIAFVVDEDRCVVGVLTDGDIRHAFVKGSGLHTPVSAVMVKQFVSGRQDEDSDALRARLPGRSQIMPILDAEGRVVDFAAPFHMPGLRAGA